MKKINTIRELRSVLGLIQERCDCSEVIYNICEDALEQTMEYEDKVHKMATSKTGNTDAMLIANYDEALQDRVNTDAMLIARQEEIIKIYETALDNIKDPTRPFNSLLLMGIARDAIRKASKI